MGDDSLGQNFPLNDQQVAFSKMIVSMIVLEDLNAFHLVKMLMLIYVVVQVHLPMVVQGIV
jgi:hypothetical protein